MAGSRVLNPHPPELEPFLYASVGLDLRGSSVTVLSTLARLNLDPWTEAAQLAALDREAAAARLGMLLSRFRDVPALEQTHGSVVWDLVRLLPRHATASGPPAAAAHGGREMFTPGVIGAIAMALAILAQMILGGSSGPGE